MFHLLLAVIYLSFISLGLPDGLLGAAWPTMYPQMGVPVSWSGIIFFIISVGTVVSSLLSDRMTRRFGTGKVTAFSVAMTAGALIGFSVSNSFWMLCIWAIPYGLGAGSVDASLNAFVALHYESRHMSWLHCMWGVGATIGPYIMGAVLTDGQIWNRGYLYVGLIQLALTLFLFVRLPIWKGKGVEDAQVEQQVVPLKEAVKLPGAAAIILTFFCYCALEQTTGLWASSYLVLNRGLSEELAASCASSYYLGITLGRFASGFITMKLSDKNMVRLGLISAGFGLLLILLPLPNMLALAGFVIAGLGSAPIFPSIIHATPDFFGPDKAQSLVGMQMASAYLGTCVMPPVYGLLADWIGIGSLPVFLLLMVASMLLLFSSACRSVTESPKKES